jgi:thioester reductase-like protein
MLQIRSSVTAIIHNAWTLNFNLALQSFEPHLQGTRRLIDLALSSANVDSVRFLFTSSIATAQSWPKKMGPYPEEIQREAKYAVGSGYGEGKYVVERVKFSYWSPMVID